MSNIKGVDEVIPQTSRDYEENMRLLKPDYLIYGKNWRDNSLKAERKRAINIMAEWGGEVIEPDCTECVSTAINQEDVYNHVSWDEELTIVE